MGSEPTEQLLDAFKAAALSVTKLYKTSATAQAKSRADGYQDCLDELLAFLDRDGIGLTEGEGSRIRKWALDKFERQDIQQGLDSDDEPDKVEPLSSPEHHRSVSMPHVSAASQNEVNMRDLATANQAPTSVVSAETDLVVPTQDTFTFVSELPYPSLANLDLSDSRHHDNAPRSTTPASSTRNGRSRTGTRSGSRAMLGRGAGTKRKVNLAEIFDLGSLGQGNGRDMFGGNSKRGRHA